MKQAYRASYKTDCIYADGYIIKNEDNTIEGVFAYDYVYIYEHNGESVFFLKTKDPCVDGDFIGCDSRFYEFATSPIKDIQPNTSYLFYCAGFPEDNSIDNFTGVSLNVQDELLDSLEIKEILSYITCVRN